MDRDFYNSSLVCKIKNNVSKEIKIWNCSSENGEWLYNGKWINLEIRRYQNKNCVYVEKND